MKKTTLAVVLTALTTTLCLAQPGVPEQNGLTPASGTIWANTNYVNNGGNESDGIDIAANGNVIVGWEDDGVWQYDYESVHTVLDFNLGFVTSEVTQSNRFVDNPAAPLFDGDYPSNYVSIANTYLSYYRSDDTPIMGLTAWGPKIKANKFGDGIGMGATAFWIGLEIDELYDMNVDSGGGGDFPAVQLMNNDGTPLRLGPINGLTNLGIVTGTSVADADPAGDVRIADWEYLSNGNIVIAGESRQHAADRPLTGQTGGNTPVYRIVTPAGDEVRAYGALFPTNDVLPNGASGMWHGIGVTANGFAARADGGATGAVVRVFDNAGNPLTGTISLRQLTGSVQAGGGGRGDGAGFHGNAMDAYVHVAGGGVGSTTNGGWITVLNADGTLRWSRALADEGDPIDNSTGERSDGAIAADGRVIAVWSSPLTNDTVEPPVLIETVQARFFSPSGCPLGSRFVVSEWESPTNSAFVLNATDQMAPRVAWRGNKIAVSWNSFNPAGYGGSIPVTAVRTFTVNASTPPSALSISESGGNVTVSWSGDGDLQSASDINGAWTPICGATSPYVTPASAAQTFFRVQGW